MKEVALLHMLQAAGHVSLISPLITSCEGQGRGDRGKAPVSCWSTAAAAGILTELIFLITVSERIDLKSTLR